MNGCKTTVGKCPSMQPKQYKSHRFPFPYFNNAFQIWSFSSSYCSVLETAVLKKNQAGLASHKNAGVGFV